MASDLSLELPGLITVEVEDSMAEKVCESRMKSLAFSIVLEVGLKDVLDHRGVAGEDLAFGVGAAENEGGGR